MGELLDERRERVKVRSDSELLPTGCAPERDQLERESPVVARRSTRIDAELSSVEQHPEAQRALLDIATDLSDVGGQRLARALRIEHEPVGDEIGRGEVGFEPALAHLREVVPLPEAEHGLEDRRQDRLGQRLLVGPASARSHVLAECRTASELPVPPLVLVEDAGERGDRGRGRHVTLS